MSNDSVGGKIVSCQTSSEMSHIDGEQSDPTVALAISDNKEEEEEDNGEAGGAGAEGADTPTTSSLSFS